jgi:hypothetical protein
LTKAEALAIFAREIMRELLRDDDAPAAPVVPSAPLPEDSGPGWAQPAFDFDESNDVCEHGGVYITRKLCPVHSDEAQAPAPTAEELDDMASEDVPAPILRARRLAEAKAKREATERQYAEDREMRGMGPPPEDE